MTGKVNDNEAASILQSDANTHKATVNLLLSSVKRAERHVNNIRNPVDLWKNLHQMYEQKRFLSLLYLRRELFALQLADYLKTNDDNAMSLFI
jgi:hypothetical protein